MWGWCVLCAGIIAESKCQSLYNYVLSLSLNSPEDQHQGQSSRAVWLPYRKITFLSPHQESAKFSNKQTTRRWRPWKLFLKLELNNSKIWKYKQISKGRNQKIFLTTASFPVRFLLITSSRILVAVLGRTSQRKIE